MKIKLVGHAIETNTTTSNDEAAQAAVLVAVAVVAHTARNEVSGCIVPRLLKIFGDGHSIRAAHCAVIIFGLAEMRTIVNSRAHEIVAVGKVQIARETFSLRRQRGGRRNKFGTRGRNTYKVILSR